MIILLTLLSNSDGFGFKKETGMKYLFAATFLLIVLSVNAQEKDHVDIISYSAPHGWKKTEQNSGINYTIVNNQTGDWCMISVYKSVASSGDLAKDFDHEWNELVTKVYENTQKPTPELVTQGGWSVQSGVASFMWQNRQSIILLNAISGYGRLTSVTVTTNTQAYQSEAEQFLDSIEMIEGTNSFAPSEPALTTSSLTGKGSGITKATTRFDDGWTAVVQTDHIELVKENTRYFSYYGIPGFNQGGERETTQHHWNRLVIPNYTITNLWLNPDVQSIGYFNYYAEGTGIEKSTGKNVFIGLRVIKESGVDFCTLAISPNKAEYQQHFPNLEMLKTMRNANRFAINKEDILGDWSSSSGSTLQYYNVYTGQDAGMQFSQGGQEFYFRVSDDYNANISGAMGTMSGSQVVFDNKYKGKFTVTDWEISMTNYGGVTQIFTAYFEALGGGRILHISKKDAPGVHYALVKVK